MSESMWSLIYQILNAAWSITLPFGFTFGIMCVAIWSLPLLMRFIRGIF